MERWGDLLKKTRWMSNRRYFLLNGWIKGTSWFSNCKVIASIPTLPLKSCLTKLTPPYALPNFVVIPQLYLHATFKAPGCACSLRHRFQSHSNVLLAKCEFKLFVWIIITATVIY